MKKLHRKLQLLSLLLVAGLLFSGLTIPVKAFIQKQGTVNEAVTLRQNADSSSDQVMELTNGQAVTVNNELKGADGAKWYQVFVNGTTLGYVPVSTVTISSSSDAGNSAPEIGGGQQTETVTITEKVGTVTANSAVRVRAQATTSSEQVASMEPNDTFLVLSDVSADDGYVWHEIEFDDHGKEVHGFVRSDLVSVKEVTREEQRPVVSIPTVTDPSDTQKDAPYSVISKANAEGTDTWYLKDAATGEEKEIASLLTPQKEKGGKGGLIVAVVILAILVLAAVGAALFFYMRWQDAEDCIEDIREKQARARKQPMQNTRTVPVNQQAASKQASAVKTPPAAKPMSELTLKAAAPKPAAPVKPAATPAAKPLGQQPAQPVSQPLPKQPAQPTNQSVPKQPAQPTSQPLPKQPAPKPSVQEELPKTKDIVNATKKELQSKQSVNPQPAKAWKSKNFLTDEDDLDFDFLEMEDK